MTKNLPLPDCYGDMEEYRLGKDCKGYDCGYFGRCSYVSRLFRETK